MASDDAGHADWSRIPVKIEIVFALPEQQELIELSVDAGTTVAQAISMSAFAGRFPQHDIDACEVGVWGNVVPRTAVLQDGDRVEIYRPLRMDPREARRQLALQGRTMGSVVPEPDD